MHFRQLAISTMSFCGLSTIHGLLTLNALVAAGEVMIPMQCEYALEGLTAVMETVARVDTSVNTEIAIEGVVRTMYDPHNSLSRGVYAAACAFGDQVYRTICHVMSGSRKHLTTVYRCSTTIVRPVVHGLISRWPVSFCVAIRR